MFCRFLGVDIEVINGLKVGWSLGNYDAQLIIDLMNKQQDKSKDQYMILTTNCLENYHNPLFFNIQEGPPSLFSHFFQKFTLPNYHLFSAFRLIPNNDINSPPNSSKKAQIMRKHRGNYRKYTVAQKEEAVKQILQGVDAKQISEKYGIPRRNLLRWKKNGCERKEGGGRPTDGEMELTLYTKINGKILLNEKDIRAEAKILSKMTDFKASKGWYCKFSRRYNQWKKQQHERTLRMEGCDHLQQPQVFLLPQVSEHSSDSEDESENI